MQQAAADEKGIAQLQDVVRFVLEEAARQGATQAAADASINQGLGVTVRLGEVETVEYQRDRGLGVTVYFGQRKGSASTADLGMQAVRETVEKACTIARYTAEDPYAGLVDPEALARDIPDLDLDHPWALHPEQAIELARRCEAAGLRRRLPHHQFRRRVGQHAAPHRRVRQLSRISRRVPRAPATRSAAR